MAGLHHRVNEITVKRSVNYGTIVKMEDREEENKILLCGFGFFFGNNQTTLLYIGIINILISFKCM